MFPTYLKITARFYYACYRKGPEEEIGTGIDLFLDWENEIWFAGTGIWPLGMGNEVLKNGNGIEVMQVNSQFFDVLSIL
jgi:hypothetical protein